MGFTGRLNTAFIERVNLTVRHGVAALARRTWATAQQSPHLLAHLEWWRAYYHFVRPHAIAASGARAATRARWQTAGATLPATDASHGSRQNEPTMDGTRGALVPLAAGFRLRGSQARWGCSTHVAGRWVKVPAEKLVWSLTRGREGLSGLPITKNRPEVGLQRADRFIHHVEWEHLPRSFVMQFGTSNH